MKKFLILFSILVVSLTGCGSIDDVWADTFNPKPFGYASCHVDPLIKSENATLYVKKYSEDFLYRFDENSFKKSAMKLTDIVVLDYLGKKDYAREKINIENRFYAVDRATSGEKVPYHLSHIVMYDTHKVVTIQDFVTSYYGGKIDFDAIMAEILKVSEDTDTLLPISFYPEGIYIIYPSKTTVKFRRGISKNATLYKESRGAAPGHLGYYVSHYRFYPVDNPQNYEDRVLPCKPLY